MNDPQHEVLTREVNVVPGVSAPAGTPQVSTVGDNRGAIRVKNLGDRENTFTVRCGRPEGIPWRAEWVSVLPSDEGRGNLHDGEAEVSTDRQECSIIVRTQSYWDVVFPLRIPIDEAGDKLTPLQSQVVEFPVTVEQQAIGRNRVDDQLQESLSMKLIVRPVYQWVAAFESRSKKIGFFRRKVTYELKIVSRSNEWLYLDLAFEGPDGITVDCDTQRIAVPPANLESARRRVLISVRGKKRRWIGEIVEVAWKANLKRIDAPSIARLPTGAFEGRCDAALGTAVQAVPAGTITPTGASASVLKLESESTSLVEGTLRDAPLIYNWFKTFFQTLFASARNLMYFAISLFVIWMGASLAYAHLVKRAGLQPTADKLRWTYGTELYVGRAKLGLPIVLEGPKGEKYDFTPRVDLKTGRLYIACPDKETWKAMSAIGTFTLRGVVEVPVFTFLPGGTDGKSTVTVVNLESGSVKLQGLSRIPVRNGLKVTFQCEVAEGDKVSKATFDPISSGVRESAVTYRKESGIYVATYDGSPEDFPKLVLTVKTLKGFTSNPIQVGDLSMGVDPPPSPTPDDSDRTVVLDRNGNKVVENDGGDNPQRTNAGQPTSEPSAAASSNLRELVGRIVRNASGSRSSYSDFARSLNDSGDDAALKVVALALSNDPEAITSYDKTGEASLTLKRLAYSALMAIDPRKFPDLDDMSALENLIAAWVSLAADNRDASLTYFRAAGGQKKDELAQQLYDALAPSFPS